MSSKEYSLGRLAGLKLSAKRSALAGTLLMWALLGAAGSRVLKLPARAAALGGLGATLLHWLSAIVHQLGHARAAHSTGYPMVGLKMWGVLESSIYPRDEPALPAEVHIRRALGGPIASLLLTLAAAAVARALRPRGGTPWWVALFFFLDNLLVFTLGAFLPLGFTDGSTLLHWWRKRSAR